MGDSEEVPRLTLGKNLYQNLRENANYSGKYLQQKASEEESYLTFSKHFTQSLATDSDYFNKLNKIFECVKKH